MVMVEQFVTNKYSALPRETSGEKYERQMCNLCCAVALDALARRWKTLGTNGALYFCSSGEWCRDVRQSVLQSDSGCPIEFHVHGHAGSGLRHFIAP